MAFVAAAIKLAIAFNTFGTNDVATFYMFARSLTDRGLEWTYRNGFVWFSGFPVFNHPPLTAYFLRGINQLSQHDFFRSFGLTFPFLLRLPGILSDLVVTVVLVRLNQSPKPQLQIPNWALALFALSPVSIMVSGFHGNTDSVVVMFLVLAAWMCLCDRPVLCGIFLALSCQIKIIGLLLLPIILLFWVGRGAGWRFITPLVSLCLVMWAEPLFRFPTLFLRNVFSYGSYWGDWGVTYWLRMTHLPQFNGSGAFYLPTAATIVGLLLKTVIVAAVFVVAWRRRRLSGRAMIDSIAYAWMVFFVFSPGVCVQYLVWLAPFVLILSPSFYVWVTAASAIFLFAFYNATAGALPWFMAISRPNLNQIWTPWSLWPWVTILAGMILLWRKATAADRELRLFSLQSYTTDERKLGIIA